MLSDQEKTNFYNSILDTLKILSPRSRDVINRRFGLKNGNKETLESIGEKYKITRERVRQVEEVALRELRKNFDTFPLKNWVAEVAKILENNQGVMREDLLFKEFSGSPESNKISAALCFLLNISNKFEYYPENKDYYSIWAFKDPIYINKARAIGEKLIEGLKKHGVPVPEENLESFFAEIIEGEPVLVRKENSGNKDAIINYLSLSKLVEKNIFNEWGLVSWPEIRPRGIKDKAYLVLKKIKKPVHFKEIANLINSYKFDSKKANVQTVHNELIKDKRFVLVGRGLYALLEWGYEPGTVKDILISLLKKYGPLPKDEIIAKVTKTRFVKPNTILLNLQDKNYFQKEKNIYKLKEA